MRQGLSEIVTRARAGGRGSQPLVTRHSLAQDAPVIELRQQPGGDVARRWRILLAEDNSINQRVAAHLLDRQGCVVDLAGNEMCIRDRLMPPPSSAISMITRPPSWKAFRRSRPSLGLPSDRRTSGASMP